VGGAAETRRQRRQACFQQILNYFSNTNKKEGGRKGIYDLVCVVESLSTLTRQWSPLWGCLLSGQDAVLISGLARPWARVPREWWSRRV
jgi:hypothetical protein